MCVSVRLDVFMLVRLHICMCVWLVYVCLSACLSACLRSVSPCDCIVVWMYACMLVRIYIYMYVRVL